MSANSRASAADAGERCSRAELQCYVTVLRLRYQQIRQEAPEIQKHVITNQPITR